MSVAVSLFLLSLSFSRLLSLSICLSLSCSLFRRRALLLSFPLTFPPALLPLLHHLLYLPPPPPAASRPLLYLSLRLLWRYRLPAQLPTPINPSVTSDPPYPLPLAPPTPFHSAQLAAWLLARCHIGVAVYRDSIVRDNYDRPYSKRRRCRTSGIEDTPVYSGNIDLPAERGSFSGRLLIRALKDTARSRRKRDALT